jgi:3'-phosphoadenosine 5'-phosphosulfate sulfotransferase (PAPS reductase)/FAD synthetase
MFNAPPHPVYALFSGGKDSFATAKALQEHDLLKGCLLLDTGISVPEWKDSCKEICERQGWGMTIVPTPVRYEWLVWKYGYPGYMSHYFTMNYLKGRAVREWKKLHPGEALASGVRKGESARRSVTTKPVSLFEGVTVYAPIYEWTTAQVWDYVKRHGYTRPRAYETLGVSGDCLCGAFAKDWERQALRMHYPAVDQRICSIGRDQHGRDWGWCSAKGEKGPEEAVICVECGDTQREVTDV